METLRNRQDEMRVRNQQAGPEQKTLCRTFEQPSLATEPHFKVAAVSVMWTMSPDTVRTLFRDEPGVMRIDSPAAPARSEGIAVCEYL